MIRYALECDRGHRFESWFGSSAAFDRLDAVSALSCPDCGSVKVTKALMAPQVQASDKPTLVAAPDPRERALAEVRRRVEENSEYVGLQFAAEARKIHLGDAPERSIWGEARPDDARSLIEDGVPVAPLPFLPARKAN